jgi:hypothetical protein
VTPYLPIYSLFVRKVYPVYCCIEEVGGIDGVRVRRNAPSVSHLLFADDSLILMKADMNNATSLQ